jgi:Na+/H+-dicarboxylate symporter
MLIPLLFIDPGKNVSLDLTNNNQEELSILEQIAKALTVSDFVELFSKSHMLALIVFSLLFGISLRVVDKENKLAKPLEILSNTVLKVVKIVMYYAPIGVFAYFASLIHSYGEQVLSSYLTSLILYIVVSIIYFLVFYTTYAYISKGKEGIKCFYKNILLT